MKYRKYMRRGFFFTTTEHRLSARLFGRDLPLAVSYDREVAPRWKWTGKVLLLVGALLVGWSPTRSSKQVLRNIKMADDDKKKAERRSGWFWLDVGIILEGISTIFELIADLIAVFFE